MSAASNWKTAAASPHAAHVISRCKQGVRLQPPLITRVGLRECHRRHQDFPGVTAGGDGRRGRRNRSANGSCLFLGRDTRACELLKEIKTGPGDCRC
jgi:hypothetical protein